jgi:hypothetical protein
MPYGQRVPAGLDGPLRAAAASRRGSNQRMGLGMKKPGGVQISDPMKLFESPSSNLSPYSGVTTDHACATQWVH